MTAILSWLVRPVWVPAKPLCRIPNEASCLGYDTLSEHASLLVPMQETLVTLAFGVGHWISA